jgi:hypothetical protein
MADLTAVGLGLDYHEIRLGKTTDAWLAAGAELRDQVAYAKPRLLRFILPIRKKSGRNRHTPCKLTNNGFSGR